MESIQDIFSIEFWSQTFLILSVGYLIFGFKVNFKRVIQQFGILWATLELGLHSYDSKIVDHLETCIQLYNVSTHIENKLNVYIELMTKDAEFMRLELEDDLGSLNHKIESLREVLLGYYTVYSNRGYYLPSEKEKFQNEILNRSMVEWFENFWGLEHKKDKLWKLINETYVEEENNFQEVFGSNASQWIHSLKILYQNGIKLYHSSNPTKSVATFNIETLVDLHSLFVELNHEETRTDEDIPIPLLVLQILTSIFKYVFYLGQDIETPLWDLKMNRIPSFLDTNREKLSQFLKQFGELEKKIYEKRTHLRHQLMGTIQTGLSETREKVKENWNGMYHMAVQVNTLPVFPDEEAYLENKYGIEGARNIMFLRQYQLSLKDFQHKVVSR